MSLLEIDSRGLRRARTRSMIQLAGLIKQTGLLESFGITLGLDLQKDITMKEPIAGLFKGLLVLKEMADSPDVHKQLWATQGLEALKKLNERKIR